MKNDIATLADVFFDHMRKAAVILKTMPKTYEAQQAGVMFDTAMLWCGVAMQKAVVDEMNQRKRSETEDEDEDNGQD